MLIAKGGYIYIMCNQHHTTLYIGVTAGLRHRVYQHREQIDKKSFTARYNLNKLIYFEVYESIESAIEREKQLKKWSRTRKESLIATQNPEWQDLWHSIQDYD